MFQTSTTNYAKGAIGVLKKLKDGGQIGNKVAVVNVGDDFGIELANAGRPLFKEAGFEIVYDKSYPLGTQDYSPVIKAAKAANPDAFVAWSYPPDTFGLADAAKIEGLKREGLLLGGGLRLPGLRRRRTAPRPRTFSVPAASSTTPEIRDFYKRHKEVTGVDADYWGSPFYYSMLQALTQVDRGGRLDGSHGDRRSLRKNKFKTADRRECNLPGQTPRQGLYGRPVAGRLLLSRRRRQCQRPPGRQAQDQLGLRTAPAGAKAARRAKIDVDHRSDRPRCERRGRVCCQLFVSRPQWAYPPPGTSESHPFDMDIVIIGLLLGGTYALMAMGLQLQYGVARIMNLANGEILIAGAFSTFWFYSATKTSPLLALFLVAPAAFVLNWAIYRVFIYPLVRRAKSQGKLEVDSILATFGISFIAVGVLLAIFGGQYLDYSYLSQPIFIFGERYGLNRVVAFLAAAVLCTALYLWLHKTRAGLALRAVSVNPSASGLVAINVAQTSALAFALGGAVTAVGGGLLSMFLTFDVSLGVVFTLKALVIVILGGVGDIRGTIVASFILGFAETAVATLIDPGLTLAAAYVLFMIVLLVRPEGLFGRRTA